MRKFWKVFLYEIITQVARPSFWLGAVGVPLLAVSLYAGVNLVNSSAPASEQSSLAMFPMAASDGAAQSFESIGELIYPSEDERLPLGVVDLAGVISQTPPELNASTTYRRFPSQNTAQQALDAGQVRAFYLFPPDFIRTGHVMYYADNLSLSRALLLDAELDYWIRYNLLDGSHEKIAAVREPLGQLEERNLDPASAPRFSMQDPTAMMLMMGVVYFLTFLLLATSGMIFSSFNRESNNRVMEVLLVSAPTEQILWGKFCALLLVGFAQIGLWMGGAALFGVQMGIAFSERALEALTPAMFTWGLIFMGLAFLLYGSLMMGLSTLFPFMREAAQVAGALFLPLFAPIVLLMIFSDTPNHPVLVLFSLFPLTAPTTILLRMLINDVPLWQALLSALLLLGSGLGIIRIVARNFRPAHLLSPLRIQWFLKNR